MKQLIEIEIVIDVDTENFPTSKIHGDLQDQIYDLTKQFLLETLDANITILTVKSK